MDSDCNSGYAVTGFDTAGKSPAAVRRLICWCLRLFLFDALCKLLLLDHSPKLVIHFGMQFLVAAVIVILDAAGKTCEQCKDDEIECGVLIGL